MRFKEFSKIVPKIYVASVQNSNRIITMSNELKRNGITNYEFNLQVPPVNKSFENITLSCTDNHQQIYKKALTNNYSYICVLEDDVYFDKDINIPELPDDFDIFYLGHFPWKIGKKINSSIYESISWCTHAYIISREGMLKMLKHSAEEMMCIARKAAPLIAKIGFKECGGIDSYIAYQVFKGNMKSYCIYPMVIYQYSIPNWERKAKFAEFMSIYIGFWPVKLICLLWIILWAILIKKIW